LREREYRSYTRDLYYLKIETRRKIERRKIKKKTREKNMKKEKKIEEKGTLTLSLHQRRKK